jgi:cytochrome c553
MHNLFRLSAALAALIALPSVGLAAGDPAAGKAKAQMCAVCHGLNGVARVPDAANLAGESTLYLTRQLQAFKIGQRQHEQMTLIAQSLSDQDMADLAAWYSSIKVTVEMPQ